jgi:mono/diheme cytochrome c family protein
MKGWSVPPSAGLLVSLAVLAGCGGDRNANSAAARDTAATPAADTAMGTSADTTRARPDTASSMARDTAVTRDSVVASRSSSPTPPVARAKPAKKATAPKPPAAQPKALQQDTSASAATPDTESQTSTTSNDTGAPLRDPYHQAPVDTVAPAVYEGWKQFNLNCARCHGEDVQGTTIAPHLIVSLRPDGPINTKELFMQTVCAGRPAKGMPSWCSLGMQMSTIESIYSYVKGRSDAKIHPGRPARKAG